MKDLSLHILDILQNSIRAKASNVKIDIIDSDKDNSISIIITDDGKGVTSEEMVQLANPFFTTRNTRRVGLGIPLFVQNVEMAKGYVKFYNNETKGLIIEAVMSKNHIDRPPMGDLAGIYTQVLICNININFVLSFSTDYGQYSISSTEILQLFDKDEILHLQKYYKMIKNIIYENIMSLKCN